MTDINGVPIIDANETPKQWPANAVGVAAIPVVLPRGQEVFEIMLREPGIIRACAFYLHQPKVLASVMKGVEHIPMPLMLVESVPNAEYQQRVFAFIASDKVFVPKEGWRAEYRATAVGQHGVNHLFELLEVPS